ncbi:MAG: DUF3299 domain-containing protein [Verrucomicrobia bacterium]|nr:DUF3299 domain-containing protein [Verrucomicrobiota bacterium]
MITQTKHSSRVNVRTTAGHWIRQGIRGLMGWCGKRQKSGAARNGCRGLPTQTRPVRPKEMAALLRERQETRSAVVRLLLYLLTPLAGFMFIFQFETPEQRAMHRLTSTALAGMVFPGSPQTSRGQKDYAELNFNDLSSYDLKVTEAMYDARKGPPEGSSGITEQIPPSVRQCDGQSVSLQGFMLPLKVVNGKAVEWLLLRDQAECCFGAMPRMNHWVLVRSPDGVKPVLGQPVTCLGTFYVGEIRDQGFLAGIYRMDALEAHLKE